MLGGSSTPVSPLRGWPGVSKQVVFAYALVGGFVFCLYARSLLPANFRYDDFVLRRLMTLPDVWQLGGSYGSTAASFVELGLHDSMGLTAGIGYLAFSLVLLLAVKPSGISELGTAQVLVALSGFVLAAMYL